MGGQVGEVVTAQTVYDLSRDWYRSRMDFDWVPLTAVEVERLLASHGLTGPFWSTDHP